MPPFLRIVACSPGVVVDGPLDAPFDQDGRVELKRTMLLGRMPECDLVVRGTIIGGHKNCRFYCDPQGTWIVEHLGGGLPTRVNDEAIWAERRSLAHGDTIEPVAADGRTVRFVFEQE